ncbi:universal stress protein [Trujillonella endophytica]|uniref:Nucleotide-binding universal stress protein, UspA family n=1 Tax=Trujillonella endophytica TaxID=673521 RepID=A0A1H8T0F9_9ACTN|nr:universal stress protein [Trujillella endophytica]SEO84256.1 Nucleotide-binding universal stress protein, UspA family [Trujillella endophytica]
MSSATTPAPVVVGIDGSESSRAVAAAATDEARLRQAPLRLLTVTTWPIRDLALSSGESAEFGAVVRGGAEVLLRDLAGEAADVLGSERVSWSVEDGDAVRALSTAATGAQLLVVGARGVGGVAGLVLGSTAAGLVTAAPCPLLVLPDETAVVVRGRTAVVVGIEGRREDEEVLAFAVAEALARGTDLVAVHAWQDAVLETAFRSMGPLVDWAGVLADEQRLLSETLAGWVEKDPDLVVREVVVRDRAASALLAASMTAQLLVLGHRHRRGLARLGSTTHSVLHRAGCPVAVVPVGAHP